MRLRKKLLQLVKDPRHLLQGGSHEEEDMGVGSEAGLKPSGCSEMLGLSLCRSNHSC